VLSLADTAIHTSMHVAPGPSALALSLDQRYLVVVHFGNVAPPGSPSNALSILDLVSGARQTMALSDPPLGVAFGADGLALVATTTEFLLLDPASGLTQFLTSVSNASANSIPAAPGTPPVEIIAAAMTASGDGNYIFGLTDSFRFVYQVSSKGLSIIGYTATPAAGPRVVSVAADGSYFAAGWALFLRSGAVLFAEFANPTGQLAVGSHAIDSKSGIIYAQIPPGGTGAPAAPVLTISDADNLTLRDQLQLPENLTGRSLLNSAATVMYSVSESDVLVVAVGSAQQAHRLAADHEDLVFRGIFSQRGVITQSFGLADPGGGQTAFALSSNLPGVTIRPVSGRTPATIQVQIDPASFQNQIGTTSGVINVASSEAVNLAPPVRLLVSNQLPDERGTSTDVPGILVDLLADPVRDRFYILRQDRNQIARLRWLQHVANRQPPYWRHTDSYGIQLRPQVSPRGSRQLAGCLCLRSGHPHAISARRFALWSLSAFNRRIRGRDTCGFKNRNGSQRPRHRSYRSRQPHGHHSGKPRDVPKFHQHRYRPGSSSERLRHHGRIRRRDRILVRFRRRHI